METNETKSRKRAKAPDAAAPAYKPESSPPTVAPRKRLTSAGDLYAETGDFRGDEQEHLYVWDLAGDGTVLARRLVAKGTNDSVQSVPRDVFRQAIRNNATMIAVAHNHPNGDATPSDDDKRLWHQMRAAGQLLGIEVIDSVVVAAGGYTSIREVTAGQSMPRELRELLAAIQSGRVELGGIALQGPDGSVKQIMGRPFPEGDDKPNKGPAN